MTRLVPLRATMISERSVADAALREAREETGIDGLRLADPDRLRSSGTQRLASLAWSSTTSVFSTLQ